MSSGIRKSIFHITDIRSEKMLGPVHDYRIDWKQPVAA